jgi:cellulose synthase/poly-beta-1,6-N-acetylglucosamine synthase-like glycosyltransferase
MTRIALGGIVRNRAWILPEYLDALDRIEFPGKEYVFLENDSSDSTLLLLDGFMRQQIAGNTRVWLGVDYRLNPPGHKRGDYGVNGYERLAKLRNLLLFLFLQTTADYFLSVDSDVIVPSDIIARLLPWADDSSIVAAAIANIPGQKPDGRTPGNFMVESAAGLIHPPEYPLQGVVEVTVTGAVYLIPRAVIAAGVRYGPHAQGEDVPFCLAAKEKGVRILVNMEVQCEHRMIEPGGAGQ